MVRAGGEDDGGAPEREVLLQRSRFNGRALWTRNASAIPNLGPPRRTKSGIAGYALTVPVFVLCLLAYQQSRGTCFVAGPLTGEVLGDRKGSPVPRRRMILRPSHVCVGNWRSA